MKTLTIHVADDGSRFDSASACFEYEKLCASVKLALAPLGPTRDIASMRYWQHNPKDVKAAWTNFITICRREFPGLEMLKRYEPSAISPGSYIGRVLSEDGRKCLRDAGYRFHSIDKEGREFDQPYWAHYRGNESLDGHKQLN